MFADPNCIVSWKQHTLGWSCCWMTITGEDNATKNISIPFQVIESDLADDGWYGRLWCGFHSMNCRGKIAANGSIRSLLEFMYYGYITRLPICSWSCWWWNGWTFNEVRGRVTPPPQLVFSFIICCCLCWQALCCLGLLLSQNSCAAHAVGWLRSWWPLGILIIHHRIVSPELNARHWMGD